MELLEPYLVWAQWEGVPIGIQSLINYGISLLDWAVGVVI